MNKCVVTGKETLNKTKNFPLSREGRGLLKDIKNKYNYLLKEKFINSFKEKSGNDSEETLEAVSQLAPRMSDHDMLKMLDKETQEDLFAKFEATEEEDDK